MANRSPSGRACIALFIALLGSRCADAEPAARDAAKSTEEFGVDMYRLLAAKEGNVLLSPFSITETLALLSAGASGKTLEEMLQALHWTQPQAGMAAAFAAQDLQLDHAAHDGAILSIANGLWYQQGGAPLESFQSIARAEYRAQVRPVDFIGNSAAVRPEINGWVEKKTLGKISSLFPEGSITLDTRLVLANAVYFKARWAHPFETEYTQERPFFVAADRSVLAPTMETSTHLRMATAAGCRLIELPYEGGRLSMVILLPGTRDGLGILEQLVSADNLALWLGYVNSAPSREIDLKMPRFKVAYAADLTRPLQQLGMAAAFAGGQADFSGINGRHDLHVSAAFHKAYMEVNEEGTVAAAATGEVMTSFAVEMSEKVSVDHPFLFVIRDTQTGSILFLGRAADPTKP